MNPIEVIKQRLQIYNSPYRNAMHCARLVYGNEGLKAFYRSYTTQLTMNIPFQVVHFISYEFLQDQLNETRRYHPVSHMVSGGGAGALAAAMTTPLDVAKTLLNTQEQKLNLSHEQRIRGMTRAIMKIYEMNGVRGYFKGITARVVYQVPSTALCWSVYELFKFALGLKETHNQSDGSDDTLNCR
jgi:solute carrier family 25 iron transporter 28/37